MANSTKTDFLSTIGQRIKNFFHKAAPIPEKVIDGAVKAEPIVDTALTLAGAGPEAALYNTVAGAVQGAEVASIAAGEQSGTGTQKAAAVLSLPAVQNAFAVFEQAVGVAAHTTAQQEQYLKSVITTLESLNGTPAA